MGLRSGEKNSLLDTILLIIAIDILLGVNQPAKPQHTHTPLLSQPMLTHRLPKPPTEPARKGGSICPRQKALQLPPEEKLCAKVGMGGGHYVSSIVGKRKCPCGDCGRASCVCPFIFLSMSPGYGSVMQNVGTHLRRAHLFPQMSN